MSEADKIAIKNAVADAVKERMSVLYWINGLFLSAMLAVFISVAWPMNNRLTDIGIESAQHATKEYVFKNYISNGLYIRLTEDEHKYDKQAIADPDKASYIYMEHKQLLDRDLGDKYRGGTN